MRLMTILVLAALLAACSAPAPDSKPAASDNPLQGTVLQDQGEAIKRAKEVEAAINDADQKRRDELDAME